jgi:leucyl-tRNA synthetase
MGITQGPEPMIQLRNQGIILGEDSEKMSKSRGNVIAPDELVRKYGADTVRAYLMFFARWDMGAPWNSSGIEGTARWLKKVWTTFLEPARQVNKADESTLRNLKRKAHQTIRSVTRDYERFEFNTVISSLMELLNHLIDAKERGAFGYREWQEALDVYVRMMAPATPHIAEELWQLLGKPYSVHTQAWPDWDEDATKEDTIVVVVQINGKLRDRLEMPASASADEIKQAALQSAAVQKHLGGKTPKQVIYVPGKLVNIVG